MTYDRLREGGKYNGKKNWTDLGVTHSITHKDNFLVVFLSKKATASYAFRKKRRTPSAVIDRMLFVSTNASWGFWMMSVFHHSTQQIPHSVLTDVFPLTQTLLSKTKGTKWLPVAQPGVLVPQGVLLQLPGRTWKDCGVSPLKKCKFYLNKKSISAYLCEGGKLTHKSDYKLVWGYLIFSIYNNKYANSYERLVHTPPTTWASCYA